MGGYKGYAEYRESGVEWIGLLPKEWAVVPMKRLLKANEGGVWGDEPKGLNDTLVLRSTEQTVDGRWKIKDPALRSLSSSERNASLLKKGDLLLTKSSGSKLHIGKTTLVSLELEENEYCYGNFMQRLRTNSYLLPKIGWYFMNNEMAREQMNLLSSSTIGLANLNASVIGDLIVPVAPIQEQVQIAKFLDHETAKIDTLISKQERLIGLLQEKRQAVISHAVTKGLDGSVGMKDSGVEWLGEVPEHWVVKSYRHACLIYRGKFSHRPRNDPSFYDGEYPFIQTGDVARANKVITSYSQTLNEKGKQVSQLFPAGTLVMTIAANIGDTAILGFEAYAPDSIVGFKPGSELELEFLKYSFMASFQALEQTSTQSTQANLNIDRIGAVKGAFPSLGEQRQIVSYLDKLLETYEKTENKAVYFIDKLKERRMALISAAVTGKIDVRDVELS